MTRLTAVLLWGAVGWAQGPGPVAPAGVPVVFPASGVLAREIGVLVREPGVARAHWGVAVAGMDGTPLFGMNEGQLFQPASNAKLFTTAAAVALLGEQRRFTTAVEGPAGSKGEAVLRGDLVLLGAGDGNLSGRDLPYSGLSSSTVKADPLRALEEFADAVAAAGVKQITGNIVGDDTIFPWQPYPADWAVDDLVWGYGAPVSALTVNDNQLRVTVTPGGRAGETASIRMDPSTPYYAVAGTVLTRASKTTDHVEYERALGSKTLMLAGFIAAGAKPETEEIAIHDPAEFAASALKGLLVDRGVRVDGEAVARHRVAGSTVSFAKEVSEPLPKLPVEGLGKTSEPVTGKSTCFDACPLRVEHTSYPVIEDVVFTNKTSQNLHAELLLRQLGKVYGADGSTAQGERVLRQFLLQAGVDKNDFVFYDGSGLSGHDLVTPRATVTLLQYAAGQPWGGVEGFASSRRGGWESGGAVYGGTAEGACICQDGHAGRGSGAERVYGVQERADGGVLDYGGQPHAGNDGAPGGDGPDGGGNLGGGVRTGSRV